MTVKEIYGTDFPIILAPMAGITDLPFRILCKEQGADVMVTEMISAKALFYGNKKDEYKRQTSESVTECMWIIHITVFHGCSGKRDTVQWRFMVM